MTKQDKETLKAKIETDISLLKKQIYTLEEKVQPITPDCSIGRVSRFESMADQEVDMKILGEALLRLKRLSYALARLESTSFGLCMECDEEIGLGRMSVRPESLKCVSCENNS